MMICTLIYKHIQVKNVYEIKQTKPNCLNSMNIYYPIQSNQHGSQSNTKIEFSHAYTQR